MVRALFPLRLLPSDFCLLLPTAVFSPRNVRQNPTGQKESQQKKVNFLIYCLFNEFQSFAEIERTKQLILTKKMSYFQRTKKILPIKVTKT